MKKPNQRDVLLIAGGVGAAALVFLACWWAFADAAPDGFPPIGSRVYLNGSPRPVVVLGYAGDFMVYRVGFQEHRMRLEAIKTW